MCRQLLATPRELLLHRLPVPVLSPTMLTMDYLNSLERDTVVSPDGMAVSPQLCSLIFALTWR